MICKNPFVKNGQAHGCGQCLPCRLNYRRIWTHRIMLEAMQHGDNAFLTLTYSDKNLPENNSLNPKHLQDFLKRFRKAIEPIRIRFYAVGEYGDESERPHYHLAIFGYPTCRYGRTRDRTVMLERPCCDLCSSLQQLWGLGHVYAGTLEDDSAQYIAGYVTKKLTRKDDPRLKGRHPEFARMSLRPGIGQSAMHDVADTLLKYDLHESEADVPSALRHGKRLLPLGPYLKRQLRKMIGKDEKTPQAIIDQHTAEMYPLREAAKHSSENPSLKSQLQKTNEGKIARTEARERIWKQRKHL